MTQIHFWTAKRSGGKITLHGVDGATQGVVKIIGIDEIKSQGGKIVATRHDGTQFELKV